LSSSASSTTSDRRPSARAQLEDLGLQREHLEQLVDARALGRGDVDEDGLAAEVLATS
jgi:hypothetical protein